MARSRLPWAKTRWMARTAFLENFNVILVGTPPASVRVTGLARNRLAVFETDTDADARREHFSLHSIDMRRAPLRPIRWTEGL